MSSIDVCDSCMNDMLEYFWPPPKDVLQAKTNNNNKVRLE
jgi:hypothetical protein